MDIKLACKVSRISQNDPDYLKWMLRDVTLLPVDEEKYTRGFEFLWTLI